MTAKHVCLACLARFRRGRPFWLPQGQHKQAGSAALAVFSQRSRAARREDFNKAPGQRIPNLQKEPETFRRRVKTGATVSPEHRPGHSGGGSIGRLGLAFGVRRARQA